MQLIYLPADLPFLPVIMRDLGVRAEPFDTPLTWNCGIAVSRERECDETMQWRILHTGQATQYVTSLIGGLAGGKRASSADLTCKSIGIFFSFSKAGKIGNHVLQ